MRRMTVAAVTMADPLSQPVRGSPTDASKVREETKFTIEEAVWTIVVLSKTEDRRFGPVDDLLVCDALWWLEEQVRMQCLRNTGGSRGH